MLKLRRATFEQHGVGNAVEMKSGERFADGKRDVARFRDAEASRKDKINREPAAAGSSTETGAGVADALQPAAAGTRGLVRHALRTAYRAVKPSLKVVDQLGQPARRQS